MFDFISAVFIQFYYIHTFDIIIHSSGKCYFSYYYVSCALGNLKEAKKQEAKILKLKFVKETKGTQRCKKIRR
jgi:hypothetical protein